MFDGVWLDSFIECWNKDPEAPAHFRDLGVVVFHVVDEGNRSVVLHWDETGAVHLSTNRKPLEFAPEFFATTQAWQAFISGQMRARRAVMTGRIKYRGSMLFALKHGDSFDWIPRVASRAMRAQGGPR